MKSLKLFRNETRRRLFFQTLGGFVLMIVFQNCGQGFSSNVESQAGGANNAEGSREPSSTAPITLPTPLIVDVAKTTIKNLSTKTIADGSAQAEIEVVFLTSSSIPVPNQSPQLTVLETGSSSPMALVATCAISDANGRSLCRVESKKAKVFEVKVVSPIQKPAPSVEFVAGPVNLAQSVFTITAGTFLADGQQKASVIVSLFDQFKNPVAGIIPTLSISGTGNANASCTTSDANGSSVCSFVSTTAESKKVSVGVDGQTCSVGDVVFNRSGVSLTEITADANAVAGAGFKGQVTLYDSNAKPWANQSVQIKVGTDALNSTTCTATTSAAGVASCTLSLKKAGKYLVSLESPYKKSGPMIGIDPAAPSRATKIVATTPIYADNIEKSTITITLMDAYDNLVSGFTPILTSTGTQNFIEVCSVSNSMGVSTCKMGSTQSETKYLSLSNVTGATGEVQFSKAPIVLTAPANLALAFGKPGSLSVTVKGSPPFTYIWYKNGNAMNSLSNIAETTSKIELNGLPSEAGVYKVYIANSEGGVTSANATLTVGEPPPRVAFANDKLRLSKGVNVEVKPRSTGTITSCVVTPALPTGLSLASNCVLSGNPSALAALSSYVITATTSKSETYSYTFSLEVLETGRVVKLINVHDFSNGYCVLADYRVKCWGYLAWPDAQGNSYRKISSPNPELVDYQFIDIWSTGSYFCGQTLSAKTICYKNAKWTDVSVGTDIQYAKFVSFAPNNGLVALDFDGNLTAYDYVPKQVFKVSGVTEVVSNNNHACFLISGVVKCYGGNYAAQLGNGATTASYNELVIVQGLPTNVSQISTTTNSSCVIDSGGKIYCWGDVMGKNYKTATMFTELGSGAVQAIAGVKPMCARFANGINCKNEYINGSAVDFNAQFGVVGINKGLESIAVGTDSACALANGGVQCWGTGNNGQRGDGSTVGSYPGTVTPNVVVGLTPSSSTSANCGANMAANLNTGVCKNIVATWVLDTAMRVQYNSTLVATNGSRLNRMPSPQSQHGWPDPGTVLPESPSYNYIINLDSCTAEYPGLTPLGWAQGLWRDCDVRYYNRRLGLAN